MIYRMLTTNRERELDRFPYGREGRVSARVGIQESPGVSLAIPVFYYKLFIKPILLAHNFLRPNLFQQADKPREKGDSADTFDGNGIRHAAKAEEQQPENERQDNPLSLHNFHFFDSYDMY